MDDAHPGRIGTERVEDLAGDEGRVGVDPGAPLQGPADQTRIGQCRFVAELGMTERREIVHRHDRGGTSGRGHDEVRAVHDVGGADEPLQRWSVPARPQGVQGPGGHGALVGRHTGGQVGADQPAPAPAHGEGPHLQVRADGECREGALAEGADAGGEAEQRGRVERDAQARRLCASGRAGAAQVVIAPSMERIAPVT